jgi:hypothetical protein
MLAHRVLLALTLALSSLAVNAAARAESAQARAPAPAIGKVLSITGSVTVERVAAVQANVARGPAQATALKEADLVYKGDVVATGPDAKVSLVFTDGTAFNVSSNARMELNEFVYNPTGTANSSMFNLVKGSFTFVAGKVAKTGNMRLETPVATMGIRGTTPHVVVLENGTVKFSTLVEEKR